MAKRSKWMEGLLYAENECKSGNVNAVVLQIDGAFMSDLYDDFDRGARDYLKHRHFVLGQSNVNKEHDLC